MKFDMSFFIRLRADKSFYINDMDDLSYISMDNHTFLQEAIIWRQELAIPLIEAGVPLDHQDDNGRTALQYAIARSLSEISQKLISQGANPNIQDKYGNNALWTAVMNPKPDYNIIAALSEVEADPNHKNVAGRTAIDMARTKKNAGIMQILSSERPIA